MTDRTELRRLLDAATPRPWVAEASGETGPVVMDAESASALDHVAKCPHYRGMADAQLIAAAVNALQSLLDQLDAAEAALDDAILYWKDTRDALARQTPHYLAVKAGVERVRELHASSGTAESQGYGAKGVYGYIAPYCTGCEASDEYATAWPCPTIRALGGERS